MQKLGYRERNAEGREHSFVRSNCRFPELSHCCFAESVPDLELNPLAKTQNWRSCFGLFAETTSKRVSVLVFGQAL
jgi:hypothetical protein